MSRSRFYSTFHVGKSSNVINNNLFRNKLLQYMWSDIHKCPMADKPLFKDDILSFEIAYKKLANYENIFSDDFSKLFKSDVKEISDND